MSIIAGQRRRKEVQKHTLNPESIATENPMYIPEVVWPTTKAARHHGSTVNHSDWGIPESSASPLYIPSDLEDKDEDE